MTKRYKVTLPVSIILNVTLDFVTEIEATDAELDLSLLTPEEFVIEKALELYENEFQEANESVLEEAANQKNWEVQETSTEKADDEATAEELS